MPISVTPDNTVFTFRSRDATWSFIRPSDPDFLLNQISDEEYEKDQFLPFWAEHWPSSEVLFSYCIDNLGRQFTSICELGSGLGVISAALAAQGHPVFATDISTQGCAYTAMNMRKYSSNGTIVCCDWRLSPFKNRFDCILGSDILYEKRWIAPVLLFLQTHLTDNGIALIADPCRDNWENFKNLAPDYGFGLIESVRKERVNEGKTSVEIIKLKKR